MQLGKIFAAQADLSVPTKIEIEVDITKGGIPAFCIVGLADKAVDESRERVNAALKNSGFPQPKQYKTTVSLSPAHLRKEGPAFDLPIALGFLSAHEEIELSFDSTNKLFVGELSLDGSLKPIGGVLSIAAAAESQGIVSLYVPAQNAQEASAISGVRVFGVTTLIQLVEHLAQEQAEVQDVSKIISPEVYRNDRENKLEDIVDFSHIIAQPQAKRALEIAAAGLHNCAMYGPPGTGKSMLAKAFCSILPNLSESKQIETSMIHSCAGLPTHGLITRPPFRAPHHTASYVAVIGGGAYPKPGEITLAHNGVLFLDEFPEFDKRVLESLREPLEEKTVRISRSKASVEFPSDFILIAAMNPPSAVCRSNDLVTRSDERKFKKKLSGPIMDRVDMWTEVSKIDTSLLLSSDNKEEASADIKKRILRARELQTNRLGMGNLNSAIKPQGIQKSTLLSKPAEEILNQASEKLGFSPRVYHKLIKLARTIADLDDSKQITEPHILEALQYRPKDII